MCFLNSWVQDSTVGIGIGALVGGLIGSRVGEATAAPWQQSEAPFVAVTWATKSQSVISLLANNDARFQNEREGTSVELH
jgi:hypothetical protein